MSLQNILGDTYDTPYSIWATLCYMCSHHATSSAYWHGSDTSIKVCDEWKDYAAFRNWALSNGWNKGLTIERVDAKGDYRPDNCQWVASAEEY